MIRKKEIEQINNSVSTILDNMFEIYEITKIFNIKYENDININNFQNMFEKIPVY
jgi:hypothetical protein